VNRPTILQNFFYRVRRAVVRNLYSITELMRGEDKEDRAAA
jgi:hypothetical protein